MSTLINKATYVETVLASAVADAGTFVVGYPTGTTQQSFIGGNQGSNHFIIQDGNNKFTSISVAFGASEITITNSTGVTLAAGSRILVALDQADGDDLVVFNHPILLASIADGDILTGLKLGIAGSIVSFRAAVTAAATTAAKLSTLNLEIGTTNLTGGVLALTSANMTPLGAVVSSTEITGNNVLTRDSLLSIEAASTTAFVEGSINLIIGIRRNLTADWY